MSHFVKLCLWSFVSGHYEENLSSDLSIVFTVRRANTEAQGNATILCTDKAEACSLCNEVQYSIVYSVYCVVCSV